MCFQTFSTVLFGRPGRTNTVTPSQSLDLLNNDLRSQTDATSLVMDLEQGKISP